MSEIVEQFVRAVYPEMTTLAITMNTEKTCLQDATRLINKLRIENDQLREQLENCMRGC